MQNLHAARPSFPSMLSNIFDARSVPKALLIMPPQESSAVRLPISFRLYHFDKRKIAPGKKAASTNPKKNRAKTAPLKLENVQS
jgi:hypothetical protein